MVVSRGWESSWEREGKGTAQWGVNYSQTGERTSGVILQHRVAIDYSNVLYI
jgi:hypothetical protein